MGKRKGRERSAVSSRQPGAFSANAAAAAAVGARSAGEGEADSAAGDGFLSSLAALRRSILGSNEVTTGTVATAVPSSSATQQTPVVTSKTSGHSTSISIPSRHEEAEIARLRADLRSSREALRSALSSHNVVLTTLRKELDELKSDVKTSESLRCAMEVQNAELKKKRDEMLQQFTTNQALRKTLENRVEALQKETQSLKEERTKQKQQYETCIQQSQKEKEQANICADGLEARLFTSERKVKELECELECQMNEYEQERIKFKDCIESLERSVKNLNGRLTCVEKERDSLKQKLSVSESEHNETKSTLKSVQAELKHAEETNTTLRSDLESSQKQIDDASSTINLMADSIKQKNEQFEEISLELQGYRDDSEKERLELQHLVNSARGDLETSRVTSTARLKELETSLSTKNTEYEKNKKMADEKLAHVTKDLMEKSALLEKREQLCTLQQSKIDSLEKQTALHVKQIKEKEALIAEATLSISNLRKEVETAKSENASSNRADTGVAAASLKKELESARAEAKRVTEESERKLKQLEEDLTEAKDELQCAEQEVKRCRQKITELENDTSKEKEDEIAKAKADADAQISLLRQKLKGAEENLLSTKKSMTEELNEAEKNHEEVLNELQAADDAMKESIGKLKEDVDNERKNASKAKAALDELTNANEALQSQLELLQKSASDKAEMSATLDEMKKKYDATTNEMQSEIDRMKSELQKLLQEKDTEKDRAEKLDVSLREALKRNEELEASMKTMAEERTRPQAVDDVAEQSSPLPGPPAKKQKTDLPDASTDVKSDDAVNVTEESNLEGQEDSVMEVERPSHENVTSNLADFFGIGATQEEEEEEEGRYDDAPEENIEDPSSLDAQQAKLLAQEKKQKE